MRAARAAGIADAAIAATNSTRADAITVIAPGSVTYVEAHGTGTDLGDPVEMAALSAAFSTGTDEKGYCAIGSLKTSPGCSRIVRNSAAALAGRRNCA